MMLYKIFLAFALIELINAASNGTKVIYKVAWCPENMKCVRLGQCPKYQNIINTSSVNARYGIIQKRHCGFDMHGDPRICCTSEEQNLEIVTSTISPNWGSSNKTSKKSVINLLPMNCGQDSSSRIVGGNISEPGEFPWLAILEFDTPEGLRLACGGSLINRRYVLTAAHCVSLKGNQQNWQLKSVRLGEYNSASEKDCIPNGEDGQICLDDYISVPIEKQIPHERYNPFFLNQYQDIALLRLARDVEFTSYIKPICLPEKEPLQDQFVVAGWGVTETGFNSELPLKVTVPYVANEECVASYQSHVLQAPQINNQSQFCAGGEMGKDSCKGDSGGPLMQQVRTSSGSVRWAAVGVVSFGPFPCGQKNWPAVYTNVYAYRSWILENLQP